MIDPVENQEELEIDAMSPEAELADLKTQAKRIGLKFSPNIGLEALREKVQEALSVDTDEEVALTPKQKRAVHNEHKERASKLVRVKIACLNPMKKEWFGELISAGNDVVGMYAKFIPFNSDKPYHIPQIIFNVLQERMCQVFVSASLPNGEKTRKGKLIKEFNLEVLPALTEKELAELAREQAARHSID